MVKMLKIRKAIQEANKRLRQPVSNNRGIALMMAIACVMMIMYFAMEVSYDSNVEYIVNSQGFNRVKAYYAAKAGMQLSLLRIKVYQQAQQQFGQTLGSNAAMLDEIWKFPFAWPLPIPAEMNAVDKSSFDKMMKESMMDASYFVTIEDEGSKIDLNDLNSPSEKLRNITKDQLLTVFQQKLKDDEAFGRQYQNQQFDQLVNSIADWMSPKSASLNGGAKTAAYGDLNSKTGSGSSEPYYPPNRAFRTLAELRMVPGMNDDFYELLEPRITIYGMKGINPNLASKEVLRSLDLGITEEIADFIIKRRGDKDEGGPFKDAQDFWNFVQSKNARLEGKTEDIPITTDSVMNFRIISTGQFAGAQREIVAIVMDLNKSAAKIKTFVDQEKKDKSQTTDKNPDGTPKTTDPAKPGTTATAKPAAPAKGAPRVVYWNER
jgi:general secretion pathway protein K